MSIIGPSSPMSGSPPPRGSPGRPVPFYGETVTGPDDRWRPEPEARDIVESGPREWPASRRRLGVVILAVAALVAGLAAGYAAGRRSRPAPAPAPAAAPAPVRSAVSGSAALTITGGVAGQQVGLCSAQVGRELQLGVEIMNQSAQRLVLRQVEPVLPLGGLQAVARAWGPCGALPGAGLPAGNVLPAGGTVWFTFTFRVLAGCPGADPVQFAVTFTPQRPSPPGFVVTTRLPGFVDLGHVPYSGCRAPASPS
jgi:hypothetical protein